MATDPSTSPSGLPGDCRLDAALARALFVSSLQRSDEPNAGQVGHAVAQAIGRFGHLGCAQQVAQAFGEHPETAVLRMRWARAAVACALGSRPGGPAMASCSADPSQPNAAEWWIFPGRAEDAAGARRWVASLAAGVCDSAISDLETAVGELFANAVGHSRSGAPGGVVAVLAMISLDEAIVHVHDQGADDGQIPHVVLTAVPATRESGRGLQIVATIASQWGNQPAVWCSQSPAADPAISAGGCCTWCRIRIGAAPLPVPRPAHHREEKVHVLA
jgi:anti-sigma regulatory factor (Ser/Thr protein kinase)